MIERRIKEAEQALKKLGKPLCLGITSRSFPVSPLPEKGGILNQFLRVEGAMVWYQLFQEEGENLVVFMVEPLG